MTLPHYSSLHDNQKIFRSWTIDYILLMQCSYVAIKNRVFKHMQCWYSVSYSITCTVNHWNISWHLVIVKDIVVTALLFDNHRSLSILLWATTPFKRVDSYFTLVWQNILLWWQSFLKIYTFSAVEIDQIFGSEQNLLQLSYQFSVLHAVRKKILLTILYKKRCNLDGFPRFDLHLSDSRMIPIHINYK